MALIEVTGYIITDLYPKTGQSGRPYIYFNLLEKTGYGDKQWTQLYQVWAWGKADVDKIMNLGAKKGSKVKVTGKQKLVDAYTKESGRIKQLKVSLQDCMLIAKSDSKQYLHAPKNTDASPTRELNGDRETLPE